LIKSLWALNRYVQRFREWRARPFDEQFATLRRTIARWVASGKEVSGTSWERAIWPGENWQPPRFRAPVLLFRSPRQPYYRPRDPEMGWGARSLGGVEICEIECRHIEMLRDPHVRLVSEKLKKRLYMIMRDDGSGSASLAKKDQPSSSKSDAWAGSTA
ncbi:MAG: hypothetical protein WA804_19035, partial [Terriglobales bacterium]